MSYLFHGVYLLIWFYNILWILVSTVYQNTSLNKNLLLLYKSVNMDMLFTWKNKFH